VQTTSIVGGKNKVAWQLDTVGPIGERTHCEKRVPQADFCLLAKVNVFYEQELP
jgi:hypothetical protein